MFFKHRHYGRLVVIWAMIAGIPITWLDLTGWPERITSYVQILVMATGIILNMRHRTGALCNQCIQQMPLDGAEQAEKRHKVLKTLHALWEGQRMLWFLLVIMALIFAGTYAPDGALRHTADSFSLLPLVVLFIAYHIHERLQLWCPFCHWGNGGEEEPSPQVTPSSPVTA
jgi:hypothetical protein